MSIQRTTNRGHHIWNDQHTVRRDQETQTSVTYILTWKNVTNQRHYAYKESKPTNSLADAMAKFEERIKTAVFVELLCYRDEAITVVRRWCNLQRYRECYPDFEWILNTSNPPYELKED